MKKLINAVGDMLRESLDGFAAAHADLVRSRMTPPLSPAPARRSGAKSR